MPQEHVNPIESLPVQVCRQLTAQIKQAPSRVGSFVQGKRFMLAEIFSPPRFAPSIEAVGGFAMSCDLKTGYDFSKAQCREETKQFLKQHPPDLLVLCPPCTYEGGWFNLNACTMDPMEYLKKRRLSRLFIRYCCDLFEQQVQAGKQALFEHPLGAKTWTYEEMQCLLNKYFHVKCHMCRFGLRLPHSKQYIRKATRLLVSHQSMTTLGLTCPGKRDPHHTCHDVVAGTHAEVGSISQYVAQYTPAFVQAVLKTVPAFERAQQVHLVQIRHDCPMEVHEVLVSREEIQGEDEEAIKRALHRLHKNLGHCSTKDLVRILRHGSASDKAIEMAKTLECDLCKSQVRPHVPLPAKPTRSCEFNVSVGIDVKWLPGWQVNQKVKALNIVCQGSCYQQMIPFFERETSCLLRQLFDSHWIQWAGIPREVIMDSAQTNLGEAMQSYLDDQGIVVRTIPAEAHWQLGRTEVHGGWFSKVLEKVILEHSPTTREEWEACVRHAHVKNQMIQNYGYTPHQHVFGKNPDIPGDLLSEPLHVVPGTAGLDDSAIAKSQAIRTSARQAVVAMQDDKALRQALAARPRAMLSYQPGDLVCYWRQQKVMGQGVVQQGGRWYGTAIVIGQVGKNYVVAHRRHIFRCAPEQMRPATTEERVLISTPQAELLGIRDLVEGGTFKSHQFVDLVPGHYPSEDQSVKSDSDKGDTPPSAQQPNMSPDHEQSEAQTSDASAVPGPMTCEPARTQETHASVSAETLSLEGLTSAPSSYGPIRRRVDQKSGAPALYRPPAMRQDDFVEVMREVLPQLLQDATETKEDQNMVHGQKRALSPDPNTTAESSAARPRTEAYDEVLSVQEVDMHLEESIETLIAAHIQKKLSKELSPSNNPPELQKLVNLSKGEEWNTISDKGAIRLHFGKKARLIRAEHADRFIGSKFVIIRKATQDGVSVDPSDPSTFKIKSRWVLQGHLDPDLEEKAASGLLQSPTLSQLGRMVLMQIIASHKWVLQLGDIKGAFLEAGELPDKFRPLYAKMPPGGIPGVPEDCVIEVVGNLYGQNDAPRAWHNTFDREATQAGWTRSILDPCLYTLRCPNSNSLLGVLGVHVDDTAVGGEGPLFEKSLEKLKARFPYRKWRISNGEFCGAMYDQCPKTFDIEMSQASFAEGLRPAHIPKGVSSNQLLNEQQIRVLRAINGSLNWLSSQSRPDLSCQTSMCQQGLPKPTVQHLRSANNTIRRAKQFKDLKIRFRSIEPESLTICCHSDAAFANVGSHTQAGYVLAFVHKKLHDGKVSPWTPVAWKSYKLPRAVSSTLGGESQAMSTASGTAEWLSLLLSETLDGPFKARDARDLLQKRPPVLVLKRSPILATDCKSLYDHLISPSSPTSIEDRRTCIDIVILRESLQLTGGSIRWLPTKWMLADGLTKDSQEPIDLLRSCVRQGTYQISPEDTVLRQQAEERERRKSLKADVMDNSVQL